MAAALVGGAFLSDSLQLLFDKLASQAQRELGLLCGLGKELERLQSTVSAIRSVVGHAETRQVAEDPNLTTWLGKLKNAAYAAEDILDEFNAEFLRRRLEEGGESRKVSRFLSPLSPKWVLFRRRIAGKIDGIRERLDEIAKERNDLRLGELDGGGGNRLEIERKGRKTSSFLSDPDVFGRDVEKEEIISSLLASDDDDDGSLSLPSSSFEPNLKNLSVLAIVGMGGLGKTTLAQLVYNDKRVKDYFQLKMWLCISDDFDVERLTKEILEYVIVTPQEEKYLESKNLNRLQESLSVRLEGKRFLLVLDDVWNDSILNWHRLRAPLIHGRKGSKVVVTTRNTNVASLMQTTAPINLEPLSFKHSWSLFRKCAFVDGNSERHPRLEAIGREIVKKLKGVPLAVKTLGSNLYSKLEERKWVSILESGIWELPQHDHDILPALKLSYHHLPPRLKQCFAYCFLFPKDHMFDKIKLVQIWMAQGFVQTQGGETIEEAGSDYFDDLLCRSFFQHFKGKYMMHDLLHDLASSISVHECYRIENDTWRKIPEEDSLHLRHLSILRDSSNPTEFENLYKFKRLRTLLCVNRNTCGIDVVPDDLFIKLKCLRVLDLSHSGIEHLPGSIGNLKQLRCLDLSYTAIKMLPGSLSTLYSLQTLGLEQCQALQELPKGTKNLINLRHLYAKAELVSKIAKIGKLTCLQELELFNVSEKKGYRISELKDMKELQGELRIQNLKNVKSKEEASQAELNNKRYLRTLVLEWADYWDVDKRNRKLDEEVLEGLLPPPHLTSMTIKFNVGINFPSWMEDQLVLNLESIRLHKCEWELLPPLGHLPYLKYLRIEEMDQVKKVGPEFCGSGGRVRFPSLKVLYFCKMSKWEEWSVGGKYQLFPCLNKLVIRDCPRLITLPMELRIRNVGLSAIPGLWGCYGTTGGSCSFRSSLEIIDCPDMSSPHEGLLQHQRRDLQRLSLRNGEELAYFPEEEGLISLKALTVENCPKLEGTCLHLPGSLKSLQINGCPGILNESLFLQLQKLSSLSFFMEKNYGSLTSCTKALQHLTALERLDIHYVDESEESLISLEYELGPDNIYNIYYSRVKLEIRRPPGLHSSNDDYSGDDNDNDSSLSMCLQNHFTSLCRLTIDGRPNIASFLTKVLPNLTSLVELEISHCKDLMPLDWLQQDLISLEVLRFEDCPDLTFPSEEVLHCLAALKASVIIDYEELTVPTPHLSETEED